jgi:hypothetical protein
VRQYLCVGCLTVVSDTELRNSISRAFPMCESCRKDYWDSCCFHCGATPMQNHEEECSARFRLES